MASSLLAFLATFLLFCLALPAVALPAPEPTVAGVRFHWQHVLAPKLPLTTTLHIPGPGPTRAVYADGIVDQGVQKYVPCYGYAGLQVVTDAGANPLATITLPGAETKTRYVCEPGPTGF